MDKHASPTLDHLVWAAASLPAGIDTLAAATGVNALPGGKHAGFGTHNALAGLGSGTYFEIIAVDPDQGGGPLADVVGHPDSPQLVAWAVRVADAGAVAMVAEAHGLTARVVPMSRRRVAGEPLRWQIVVVGGHPHRGTLPFFIDWLDTPHPSRSLTDAAFLESFTIESPFAPELAGLLYGFHIVAEVVPAAQHGLRARLRGPDGVLDMSGPAGGLMTVLL